MILSLNAGDLEEIELPAIVGAYVMNSRPDYKISCTVRTRPEYLAFGFLKDKNEALRDKFNESLAAIKADGTLDAMKTRYLRTDGETESATFEKFAGADTIRVAVTGDLPPVAPARAALITLPATAKQQVSTRHFLQRSQRGSKLIYALSTRTRERWRLH